MAEADAFIFAALQQSGMLEASFQGSSWSVSALTSDAFIAIVFQFLTQLQTSDDNVTFTLPSTLTNTPVGVAARHRVGSKLANILKELGYAGDCGYNHFLYPSEKETRNILSCFLSPQAAEAEDDKFAIIQPQSFLANTLPDVPLSLESVSPGIAGGDVTSGDIIMESVGSSGVATKNVAGEENFMQTQLSEETEEQALEQVQKQVDDTEHRIAAMRKVLDRERGELQQVEQHVLETQTTGQEMQKQLARQKQLITMLPQAQANIAKLESIFQKNAEKKAEIAQQMESARDPLLKEYAQLESQKSNRKARCRQLIREMKTFRSDMLELTGVIHSKMESVRALERIHERQLAKLDKKKDCQDEGPMTRNMYTARIMDIIKQVHKQKQDITKILDDIKGLQKQMNVASEKLKRTEAVAEDKLYTAASKSKTSNSGKSEAYVECYRKFAQVRELFEELIVLVGDVGKKENIARDLQNWISQLEARDSSSHLDKVLADLESVRHENGTLQNELRACSA
ncbi:hypothetical protein BBJ29_000595 [Phytophthora kernoviae]|uniref:Coiled-coil domain-containing protein 22 homolog n=1 Tax=Phytophthora kernoviae TaxID=325452 RepID=A0A421FMT2_9STRA|nr:hypothetical protein BBJ29_000595 [Phytophthora kernoviae]